MRPHSWVTKPEGVPSPKAFGDVVMIYGKTLCERCGQVASFSIDEPFGITNPPDCDEHLVKTIIES